MIPIITKHRIILPTIVEVHAHSDTNALLITSADGFTSHLIPPIGVTNIEMLHEYFTHVSSKKRVFIFKQVGESVLLKKSNKDNTEKNQK